MAIYQKPNASTHISHYIYTYLLKNLTIDQPNQVWCADIIYIPTKGNCLLWWIGVQEKEYNGDSQIRLIYSFVSMLGKKQSPSMTSWNL